MSKYAPIDILKLYSGTAMGFEDDYKPQDEDATAIHNSHRSHNALKSHEKWNIWLSECFRLGDLNQLIDVRYRLQVGMNECVKKKLATQKISEMYVRWIGSIDRTARRIIKNKYPIPKDGGAKALTMKRARDQELENYLRKTSF